MMKIIQIMGRYCHWDASGVVRSLDECRRRFAADMVFVEAPDHVREGWGYDPDAEGDARFIKPEAPEGWLYDDETGTFYEEGDVTPSELRMSPEELAREYLQLKKVNEDLSTQLLEVQTALCDMFETMMGV